MYTKVNIPFTTAVFGGEVLVTTLYGNVMCKIRPGTQSGTKIRLRGKGIVSMKNTSAHGGSIRNSADRGAEISESGSKTKVKRV